MRRIACALGVLLGASMLFGQTPDTASVRTVVTDPHGGVVAGAQVVLENVASGTRRIVKADVHGEAVFAAVPVTGSYVLHVEQPGFANASEGPFALRGGETATMRVQLSVVSASGAVIVYGTSERVRSDSPELSTRLDERALREVPVFARKVTALPLLNSAVRPARGTGDLFLNNFLYVINGGGRRQTTYAIDGSTGDDAWGRQTIFTNVPLSAIHELTVLTNAFSSEYGRTTGSAINVVTQSGSNELRSDVVALSRPTGSDRLNQLSGAISGPIVVDRTHFLVAAEYNDQRRQSRITSPLAPGIYTGDYKQAVAMARLDHELGDANHLMARVNVDRFTDSNPADVVGGVTLPSAGRQFRRNTSSLQVSDAATLGASMFNEARAIGQWGSPITEFEPLHPSTQFVRPGVSTEGESRSAKLFNHQYQLADTVSWSAGRHFVRAGADVIHSRSGGNGQEFGAPFVLGQFTFKTGIPVTTPTSALTIADVARFAQGFGNVSYSVNDNLYGVFLQDDWHPDPRLTFNLGIRYDRQQLTGDDNNIAPRLGFAFNANPRTVFRGGYGVFYSQIRSNIVAGWELNGPQGFFTFSVAPGQFGFPTSLQPLPAFPPGANLPARDITIRPGRRAYYQQFFDVSKLRFYSDQLSNPRTQQMTLGSEREVAANWFVSIDGVYAHTSGIEWNLDANAPAAFERTSPSQTRSAAAADATRPIVPVINGYRRILVTTNNGQAKYRGVQVQARKTFEDRFGVMASYTWSHTTNNVEPDAPGGDPNDVNLIGGEWANSLLDQRHRAVLTVWRRVPFGIVVGGVATAASGRPYNITTGSDTNGDAATTDRPVIDGAVIGRNAGRGTSIFDLDVFAEKTWQRLTLRAEAFNVTNHVNVVGRNGVFGSPTFGQPLGGINNVDPLRAVQFSLRFRR